MSAHRFTIDADHASLDGHFPGHPVVPGVVLLDQVEQALARHHGGRIRRILRCKFVAELGPGQACTVELSPGDVGRLRFVCNGAEGCVARGLLEWEPIDG